MEDQAIAVTTIGGAPAEVFDVSKFEAVDFAWCDILDKKEEGPLLYNGQPVRARVRSPGTREAVAAQHKVDQASQAKTYAALRGKALKESVDDQIDSRANKLAAVTIEFENFPLAPLAVFKNPKLGYITNQVERFHGAWENF